MNVIVPTCFMASGRCLSKLCWLQDAFTVSTSGWGNLRCREWLDQKASFPLLPSDVQGTPSLLPCASLVLPLSQWSLLFTPFLCLPKCKQRSSMVQGLLPASHFYRRRLCPSPTDSKLGTSGLGFARHGCGSSEMPATLPHTKCVCMCVLPTLIPSDH